MIGKWFQNMFKGGIEGVGNAVSGVLDKVITNDDERLEAKQKIMNEVQEFGSSLIEAQKEIMVTEMKGNWLQRSWRPIIMLAFGFIVIYEYFISRAFGLPQADLPANFWSLLEIGLGGYVIGRSAEKIVTQFTDNMDKIPRKSKRT
jgi:hypothetical protein